MCIVLCKMPKSEDVADGTINALPLATTSGGMKPIGMNVRDSDETLGNRRYDVSGCRFSPKRLGNAASF
jgi:hypothetical protein